MLAQVIDLRDPYVLDHSRQVTRYAVSIAREMRLEEDQVEVIRKASLMHDLGKLGIQTDLLSKFPPDQRRVQTIKIARYGWCRPAAKEQGTEITDLYRAASPRAL